MARGSWQAARVAERGVPASDRGGRPAVTSAHELAAVAQRLFVAGGFDETSVEDIAAAAGIGRRTFFRYFPTKADVLFADSPRELARLREGLAEARPGEPYRTVVTRAVVEALRIPPGEREWALHRAQLFFTVPAVQAHAARVWAEWRRLAADHARTVPHADPLFPVAVGHAVLAGTLAAHEQWLTVPDEDLDRLLAGMLDLLLPPEPPPA
ncbi:TetR family transcriptional regulator [Geodermatophilus sp. DF01-2]|nr:TetR family transcriptional regulator [Geodermatophilus sp. DF01_2]